MTRNILLLEPNYKNKYPPIGLMKISSYHKRLGDNVEFYKGDLRKLLVDLKYRKCLEELQLKFPDTDWRKNEHLIKSYFSGRRVLHLTTILESYTDQTKKELELIFKYYSKFKPKNIWDRIYVATLFTFYWKITVETIQFAKSLVDDPDKIYVGGVLATLLPEEIFKETGIRPHTGLLDKPGLLDQGNKLIIDELPLDYSILDEIEYSYPTQSAYFTYMTKGCTRKCTFCSVPKLEPVYKDKIPALEKFNFVNQRYGEQRNLLLMDNNVLASPKFPEIIEEIREMGFTKGATYEQPNTLELAIENIKKNIDTKTNIPKAYLLIKKFEGRIRGKDKDFYSSVITKYNLCTLDSVNSSNLILAYSDIKYIYEKYRFKGKIERYVDFNQGVDARYVTDENMRLMSSIPIRPLRIAFDHIGIKNTYIKAVELAAKHGITELSNYILYNFQDKPEDLYERLRINVDLGKQYSINIFSFPMKYIPLTGEEAKHRKYIGKHWNKKFVRAIQCILNATKGIVAPGYDFFLMAFGSSIVEFQKLLWMPEAYIINREFFRKNGMVKKWEDDFNSLNENDKILATEIIAHGNLTNPTELTENHNILKLLSHYSHYNVDKTIIDHEVRKLRNKYNRLIKKDVFINLTLTHDFDSKQRTKMHID